MPECPLETGASSQGIRGAHRRESPRPPDRQSPHSHWPHEPLLSPQHRRDRSRGM